MTSDRNLAAVEVEGEKRPRPQRRINLRSCWRRFLQLHECNLFEQRNDEKGPLTALICCTTSKVENARRGCILNGINRSRRVCLMMLDFDPIFRPDQMDFRRHSSSAKLRHKDKASSLLGNVNRRSEGNRNVAPDWRRGGGQRAARATVRRTVEPFGEWQPAMTPAARRHRTARPSRP